MKRRTGWLLLLICCLFGGCSQEPVPKEKAPQKEESIFKKVQENREGELVFSFSLQDYINHYNEICGEEYLLPISDWYVTTLPQGIHTDHKTLRYDFTADKTVWSMPTISVYVPMNSDTVQEITVNFDEHGYTDALYDTYETLCFHTLQVLFPNMKEENIVSLYENIIRLAHENTMPNEQAYENGTIPCVLYEKDGVGIYPYFAIGESLHLCIIPVTEESLAKWQEKGVEVLAVE